MLDPWIIEEIRRREEEQRRQHERPMLEIQIETPAERPMERGGSGEGGKVERGVVVIDFSV